MNSSDSELDEWIAKLGISTAPVPRKGIGVALAFFNMHMPSLSRPLRHAFLKAMDLSKPVRAITLEPPLALAAFRKCNEDPFKLFYTKIGTAAGRTGLNTNNRVFLRYTLLNRVQVLESRCAPALDTWTDDRKYILANGGAVQYVVPESFRYLRIAAVGQPKS